MGFRSWVKPIDYSNGVAAEGRLVFVAGQVGWNARGEFESTISSASSGSA
jgi:enamine deaminase RidA (YjgF/YER057c/UK114 family)